MASNGHPSEVSGCRPPSSRDLGRLKARSISTSAIPFFRILRGGISGPADFLGLCKLLYLAVYIQPASAPFLPAALESKGCSMLPYTSKQVSHPPTPPPETEKEDSLPPHRRKPQVRGADRCILSLGPPALWLQALYTLSLGLLPIRPLFLSSESEPSSPRVK